MTNNPLEEDSARDQRVRERAYHLWQADGEPHGADFEYWERARELIAIEDSAGAAEIPFSEDERNLSEPVEEAFIQDNLGEFPDRLADQGERRQTPAADRHGE